MFGVFELILFEVCWITICIDLCFYQNWQVFGHYFLFILLFCILFYGFFILFFVFNFRISVWFIFIIYPFTAIVTLFIHSFPDLFSSFFPDLFSSFPMITFSFSSLFKKLVFNSFSCKYDAYVSSGMISRDLFCSFEWATFLCFFLCLVIFFVCGCRTDHLNIIMLPL